VTARVELPHRVVLENADVVFRVSEYKNGKARVALEATVGERTRIDEREVRRKEELPALRDLHAAVLAYLNAAAASANGFVSTRLGREAYERLRRAAVVVTLARDPRPGRLGAQKPPKTSPPKTRKRKP
jgi:hypothetical protein